MRSKRFSPSVKRLIEAGIKVTVLRQGPGEAVVTLPNGWHGGFNTGFNCNEAINFVADGFEEEMVNGLSTTCGCRTGSEESA